MNDDYIKMALQDDGNLKVILKGCVENVAQEKVGVVSVVYLTKDPKKAEQKFTEYNANKEEGDYYMVYSCPLDTFLPSLGHYPSIEIHQEDLNGK